MKVPRIQRNPPNDLVNPPQLSHRELGGTKLRPQRRVLQLGPSPLHAILKDPSVVERQRRDLPHRHPRGSRRVRPSHRNRQIRRQRQVRNRYNPHPRITPRLPIRPQLLQVQPGHSGLLRQLPNGRGIHRLGHLHEPARQRPPPPKRRLPTPNQQRTQRIGPHGQHHQVDRDREGREITWPVHTTEYRLIVRSTTSQQRGDPDGRHQPLPRTQAPARSPHSPHQTHPQGRGRPRGHGPELLVPPEDRRAQRGSGGRPRAPDALPREDARLPGRHGPADRHLPLHQP